MSRLTYFIAGTDTEVGKTTITCLLLQACKRQALSTAAYKPIASGLGHFRGHHGNTDTLQLAYITGQNSKDVTPFAFEPAIAPHIAATRVNFSLSIQELDRAMSHKDPRDADITFIEGCGGWLTPLNHHQTMGQWVASRSWDVILVVGLKLGGLNHALLTQMAITQSDLRLAAWVGVIQEPYDAMQDNIDTLGAMIDAPCLGIMPPVADKDQLMAMTSGDMHHASDFLNIKPLLI